MKQNEFDDYLVRGWESGANLFYNGRVYFSQCDYYKEHELFRFYVISFKAEKYGEHSFSTYVDKTMHYIDLKCHIDKHFKTREEAKGYCLSEKIFEGKSFWEIGMKFEWLDDDGPDIVAEK